MSTAPKIEDNKKEVNLNNNEEALIIRKIYSLFEENRNKDTGNNKKSIYELDNNKSINLNNLNNIIGINSPQKNKYKIKLQKILIRNKIEE